MKDIFDIKEKLQELKIELFYLKNKFYKSRKTRLYICLLENDIETLKWILKK